MCRFSFCEVVNSVEVLFAKKNFIFLTTWDLKASEAEREGTRPISQHAMRQFFLEVEYAQIPGGGMIQCYSDATTPLWTTSIDYANHIYVYIYMRVCVCMRDMNICMCIQVRVCIYVSKFVFVCVLFSVSVCVSCIL